jgi:hypothetical protein
MNERLRTKLQRKTGRYDIHKAWSTYTVEVLIQFSLFLLLITIAFVFFQSLNISYDS